MINWHAVGGLGGAGFAHALITASCLDDAEQILQMMPGIEQSPFSTNFWDEQHCGRSTTRKVPQSDAALLCPGLWFRLRMQRVETSFFLKGHLRNLAVPPQTIVHCSADYGLMDTA